MTKASRQLRSYRRRRQGRIVASVEVDELAVAEMLAQHGYLDPMADDREALNAALARMIEDLSRQNAARQNEL